VLINKVYIELEHFFLCPVYVFDDSIVSVALWRIMWPTFHLKDGARSMTNGFDPIKFFQKHTYLPRRQQCQGRSYNMKYMKCDV